MKLVSFAEIAELKIQPSTCCQWVEEALRLKSSSTLPKKISLSIKDKPGVFYNTMPSLLPSMCRGGVKLVTRYPHRTPALDSELLLYDTETGDLLALMDADWITTMRTGAVAAHSISLLAKQNFANVGFFGLGNTARATLLCLRDMVPDSELNIGLLAYKDQHFDFKKRFDDMPGISFEFFDSPSDLANWSEVLVSCVTVAEKDFCSPDCFRPGSLLVPVHTRGFAACDLEFDKVFADDRAHVSGFKYYDQFKDKLTETADVISGLSLGRENDLERILVYNIGISLHDMFFASKILDLIGDGSLDVCLEKPDKKFWV